ncbi:MAG: GNAT family N-acetyltransferase [Pseudomonadota bacterium]
MTATTFHIPTLATERLTLRALRLDDFEALAAFYSSERAKVVGGPQRPDQTWRSLATELGHWALRGYGRWALEETASGAFVGVSGLWEPEGFPELELGWDLMDGFEGRGYATEAGRAARAYAYGTLGATTVISLIAPGNDGSKGVARRLGAAYERDFDHVSFGRTEIWRHPGPEARAA